MNISPVAMNRMNVARQMNQNTQRKVELLNSQTSFQNNAVSFGSGRFVRALAGAAAILSVFGIAVPTAKAASVDAEPKDAYVEKIPTPAAESVTHPYDYIEVASRTVASQSVASKTPDETTAAGNKKADSVVVSEMSTQAPHPFIPGTFVPVDQYSQDSIDRYIDQAVIPDENHIQDGDDFVIQLLKQEKNVEILRDSALERRERALQDCDRAQAALDRGRDGEISNVEMNYSISYNLNQSKINARYANTMDDTADEFSSEAATLQSIINRFSAEPVPTPAPAPAKVTLPNIDTVEMLSGYGATVCSHILGVIPEENLISENDPDQPAKIGENRTLIRNEASALEIEAQRLSIEADILYAQLSAGAADGSLTRGEIDEMAMAVASKRTSAERNAKIASYMKEIAGISDPNMLRGYMMAEYKPGQTYQVGENRWLMLDPVSGELSAYSGDRTYSAGDGSFFVINPATGKVQIHSVPTRPEK